MLSRIGMSVFSCLVLLCLSQAQGQPVVSVNENLLWKTFENYAQPTGKLTNESAILNGQFVATQSGIDRSVSGLEYAEDPDDLDNLIYRFTMSPRHDGKKSRLQLITCYVTPEDLSEKFGSPVLDPTLGSSLITYCNAANEPENGIHSYSYDIFLPRSGISESGYFILTQWQGTADPNIVKDEQGCVARLSNEDRHRLCEEMGNTCDDGTVLLPNGESSGIHYQHGGYPPLILAVEDGNLIVAARSDERKFIEKGGCGVGKPTPYNRTCALHPRQQHSLLWRMPIEDSMLDRWINLEWKIKWSEYSSNYRFHPEDPGVLTSNAWIRLSIDGEEMFDWKGPCGRNDEGRIPTFRTGINNPDAEPYPFTMYMRRYEYDYVTTVDNTDEAETLRSLIVRDVATTQNIGRNTVNEDMIFRRVSGSCTLRPGVNFVNLLTQTKLSSLKANRKTREFYQTLVKALQSQEEKIRRLERKLPSFEENDSQSYSPK
ncbi:uncharacterized protein LOC143465657 [Clavelina lepadiformis]|uniref:Secreted protein n=1 Tax=Clavelina lepadiformis TaxID=159417 RepID=A0ABP0F0M2_CLALP